MTEPAGVSPAYLEPTPTSAAPDPRIPASRASDAAPEPDVAPEPAVVAEPDAGPGDATPEPDAAPEPDAGTGDATGAGAVGTDLPGALLPDEATAASPPYVESARVKPGKHARGGGDSRTPRVTRGGRRTRKGLLPALVVLVVLLAVLVGFLGRLSVTTRGADPLELQRRDALAVARASSRVIFSYDYRHLAQDFAAGRVFTTGAFRTEYDTTTTKLVTDVAQRYKGVAVADVSAAAVETSSNNNVVVLVFLNQQSSSTIQTTPKISQSRLEMTLVRIGGHWLVSGVKAL